MHACTCTHTPCPRCHAPATRPQEIQHAYHSNGLLIKLLIDQAENNGVRLRVDTNNLENEVLLKQVSRWRPNAALESAQAPWVLNTRGAGQVTDAHRAARAPLTQAAPPPPARAGGAQRARGTQPLLLHL